MIGTWGMHPFLFNILRQNWSLELKILPSDRLFNQISLHFNLALLSLLVVFSFLQNFWITESSRRGCHEQHSMPSSLERRLKEGHRFVPVLSTATPVRNLPISNQQLETALKRIATPTPRAEGEHIFDGSAGRSVSEERPYSIVRPSRSCACAS